MINKNDISWYSIHECPNFTKKWLLKFPDEHWAWGSLHEHPKFKFDWVHTFIDKPWDWIELSKLATVPLIRQYPMFKWDWKVVTCNSKVSKSDMAKNTDLPWCVEDLRFNEITEDDIEFLYVFRENIDWENDSISQCATLRIVRQTMDLPWFFYIINLEKYPITQDDLEFIHYTSSDEYIWDMARISYLTSFELIAKNKHMNWEPEMLSSNPTVTYDDVQNHPDLPWDLTIAPCEPIERIIRRWVAANLIKRRFRNAMSNPEYKMCRNRLLKEFENLL